ncbi:hypothetical protein [Nocardia sp. NPDC046763]
MSFYVAATRGEGIVTENTCASSVLDRLPKQRRRTVLTVVDPPAPW